MVPEDWASSSHDMRQAPFPGRNRFRPRINFSEPIGINCSEGLRPRWLIPLPESILPSQGNDDEFAENSLRTNCFSPHRHYITKGPESTEMKKCGAGSRSEAGESNVPGPPRASVFPLRQSTFSTKHMNSILDRYFHYSSLGSSLRTETIAGLSTFAAMAYIICIQPALFSGQMTGTATGMPFGALVTTTCIASAFGTILMGVLANYPIGLAPGMGTNFFVMFSVMGACAAVTGGKVGDPVVWQTAMGVVLISGVLFLIISFTKLRQLMLRSLSPSLKIAIVTGIGLFIAMVGLKNGGIIAVENNLMTLKTAVTDSSSLVFFTGVLTITVLQHFKVRGSILIGILVSALAAFLCGKISFQGIVGLPADPMPVVFKADVATVCRHLLELLPLIFLCFFMDMFDTMGTVLGVATSAKLLNKNNEIDRIERVFAADATATVAGALCGQSTVTSYLESAAGAEAGGRTGLTAIVIGLCFLLAMFFTPLIAAVAGYPPVTSGALVVVGAMMMRSISEIRWDDRTEGIPAFLIFAGIPFSNSIIGGISVGIILYPFLKACCGKIRELNWFIWLAAAVLILYLVLLNGK